ncbi:MAG: alpha/beta hydrolase [Pseudomonadota bacterium]
MSWKKLHLVALIAVAFLACSVDKAHAEPARFSVTVEGQGSDVILIPGLGTSRDAYAQEAAALRGAHRLHLIQLAGFAGEAPGPNAEGEILAPFVEELDAYIKANHLDHPAVIGHSMGGLAGLMLARRHPDDVGRLMVVDALPFYSAMFDPNATAASVAPQAQAVRGQLIAASDDQFAAMQQGGVARLVKTAELRQRVVDWTLRSDRRVLAEAMYEALTTDMRGELAHISTPITVLYAYDPVMGPQAMLDGLYQSAYAAAPHVQLTRVDGSFHFIMLDQPGAFDRAVQDFLSH